MKKKKEKILVFSSHSDDFVIGAGGTIANYIQKGSKVKAIVFTYGEKSHPWLKEKVVQKMRFKETAEAGKLLNCQVAFFGLREGHFVEDYTPAVEEKLLKIIHQFKPTKIFTHSREDPHPDHSSVNKITLGLYDKIKYHPKPEVYIYSIWNPVSFKTLYPSLYIDISDTFFKKLKVLRAFHSQQVHIAYPVFLLVYRAIKDGLKMGKRFGEHFFRIK